MGGADGAFDCECDARSDSKWSARADCSVRNSWRARRVAAEREL
jgi:hypothetical protein